MASLSVLRPYVAPHCLGATDMLIDRALLDSAIELCEKSLIQKANLDAFSTRAGITGYDVDTPADTKVTRIHRLWVNLLEAEPIDDEQTPVDAYTSAGRTGLPRAFYEAAPGTVGLYPTPDTVYPVTVRASLKPSRFATTLDDELVEAWGEVIADGALARMFAQLQQPWGNPTLAAAHGGRFQAGISRAILEASRQMTRAEPRIQLPRI
jgi:hypothetical protein